MSTSRPRKATSVSNPAPCIESDPANEPNVPNEPYSAKLVSPQFTPIIMRKSCQPVAALMASFGPQLKLAGNPAQPAVPAGQRSTSLCTPASCNDPVSVSPHPPPGTAVQALSC